MIESESDQLNGGSMLRMVGTDARRLALVQETCLRVGEPASASAGSLPVVPAESLRMLVRALDRMEESLSVKFAFGSAGTIGFRAEGVTLSSRLLEGRFPDWRRVLPADPAAVVTFDGPADLVQALRLVGATTTTEARCVHLELAPGRLMFRTRAADVGQSEVTLDVFYEGDVIHSYFDIKFLLEGLVPVPDGRLIQFRFPYHGEAACIAMGDEYQYIISTMTPEQGVPLPPARGGKQAVPVA